MEASLRSSFVKSYSGQASPQIYVALLPAHILALSARKGLHDLAKVADAPLELPLVLQSRLVADWSMRNSHELRHLITLVDILVWYGLNGYITYLIFKCFVYNSPCQKGKKDQKGHSWNQQVTLQCADQIIRFHLQLQQFSRHLFHSDPDDPTLHGACNGEPRRPRRQWLVKWEGYGGSRLISISDYCNYCILLYHIVSLSQCRKGVRLVPYTILLQHWGAALRNHRSKVLVNVGHIVVTFFSSDFELNLLSSRDTAVVAMVWLICQVQIWSFWRSLAVAMVSQIWAINFHRRGKLLRSALSTLHISSYWIFVSGKNTEGPRV